MKEIQEFAQQVIDNDEKVIIVNLSGRGDKDLGIVFSQLEKERR